MALRIPLTQKTFETTDEPLLDMLRASARGKLQLPDFQRGWVWDDERIRSLLTSVSLSYPIGAVMLLQAGGQEVRFQPRLIEGVSKDEATEEPEDLILDGQQRLTSLFQALFMNRIVETKDDRGNRIRRWYYVDIRKALDPEADPEEAIVGIPEDRRLRDFRGQVKMDYSTLDLECREEMLPLSVVFNDSQRNNWQHHYIFGQQPADPETMQARSKRWNQLHESVIRRFQEYRIPVIRMMKGTPKEAVCQVFEKVNTGGVSLNVFELLTATFAVDSFNLRDDWKARERVLQKLPVLRGIETTQFLQAITLLTTRDKRNRAIAQGISTEQAPGIACKRKDVLDLTLAEYRRWADSVTEAFEGAARFLHRERVFSARDLPYRTQVTSLAAIMTVLGPKAENDGVHRRLAQWFWCGVFGELYGGAIETRFARDLPEVVGWIDGGPQPTTVGDANFTPGRLLTLRSRNSAAYKGIHALVIRDDGQDFRTGNAIDQAIYFDQKIDIHHIFPQKWCRDHGIEAARCDAIVNKTAIDARTNRIVSGNPPSQYVPRLQRIAAIDERRMDEILQSHVIDPRHLRSDDFGGFFQTRAEALLQRIEKAIGKPIAREFFSEGEPEPATDYELDDETAGVAA